VTTSICPGLLNLVCQAAGSVGSSAAGAGAGDVLGAVAGWVVAGASWLLGQIGGALSSSTSVDLGAGWFTSHYQVMVGLATVVVLPLLLLSIVQAVYRQSAAVLVRTVAVQLPLALVLAGVAVQLVQLSLAATDALSSTVSSGVGADVQQALSGVAGALVSQAGGGPDSVPTFVVLLGALLVAFGAFVLWVELLVRAAAVYVAVLFLPLAMASLVWPAVSHWCRRLVDTLVALVLAKFVIVAVLSLAAAAVASGNQSGFASVLAGGALLFLAAFTPFTLLRLVPAVEAGAVHQLEGARHRVRQAFGSMPRSAVTHALRAARSSSLVTGEPGTGSPGSFGAPGDDGQGDGGRAGDDEEGGGSGERPPLVGAGGGRGSLAPTGGRATRGVHEPAEIPQWRGVPPSGASSLDTLPAPERLEWGLADPLGRGPLPVWGGSVPDRDPGDSHGGERAPRAGLALGRDALGPVISGWELTGSPEGTGGGAGAAGSGGRSANEGGADGT
jgi:hypothetical protein